MAVRMQQRRATSEQWLLADPVLAEGEIGLETDTQSFKIGDGVNNWSLLDYFETSTSLQATIDEYIPLSQKGAALGVAELDANGFVPSAQLDIDLTAYYTSIETDSAITAAVNGLIDSAPATLDTLNELAAALADDADFATTITNSLANKSDVGHTHAIDDLSDVTITSATQNQVIKFDGSAWVNAAAGGGILASDTAPTDTDAYPLWYNTTEGRAYIYYDSFWVELTPSIQGEPGVIAATSPLSYDASSQTVSIDLSAYDTSSEVDDKIAALVDSAPATLDTLNELAAALGDDANFATTVSTALAAKAPSDSPTFTGTVDASGAVLRASFQNGIEFYGFQGGYTGLTDTIYPGGTTANPVFYFLPGQTGTIALTSDLDTKAPLNQTISTKTADYTLQASDSGSIIKVNGTATITIPSSTIPAGGRIDVVNVGTGVVTFAGSGVTISSKGGKLTIATQYSAATLISDSTTTAILVGDIA